MRFFKVDQSTVTELKENVSYKYKYIIIKVK